MIRLLRIVGFLMIAAGAVTLLTYLVPPLRFLWVWFRKLPMPIQVGLGVSLAGFLLILATLLWERWEEREADRKLRED